jgi:dipeptidyl aminopeptidase/acylaminoacyl peptidase
MICPYCNGDNIDTYKFCRHCGAKRPETPATYVLPQAAPPPAGPAAPPPSPAAPTLYTPPPAVPPYTPPVTPAPYTPPLDAQPIQAEKKGRPTLLVGAIAVVVVVCLAAASYAVFGIWKPFKSTQMLVGFTNTSNQVDLYLLKIDEKEKDKDPFVDQIEEDSAYFFARTNNNPVYKLSKPTFNYGSFVPGSNNVLVWYKDGDKTYIKQIKVSADTPDDLINASNATMSGFVANNKTLNIAESLSDSSRCYFAEPGKEAERLGKGNACLFSIDGSTVVIADGTTDSRTLSAIDVGKDKTYDIFDEEPGMQDAVISAEGSKIAYIQQQNDNSRVTLIEKKNGDTLNESDDFPRYVGMSFAPAGTNFFYILGNQDDEMELYVMNSKDNTLVKTAKYIGAQFSPKGDQLIYITGDADGARTLYIHHMSGGDDEEIANNDSLAYDVLYSPELILYTQKDGKDLVVSSTDIKGKNSVELYRQEDMELQSLQYVPGQKQVYLLLRDTDGKTTLYVTPVDKKSGFNLIDAWAEINLMSLSSDNKTLAFTGRESASDDRYLFSVNVKDGADIVELDSDAVDIRNAAFTGNNSEIIYTAATGSNPDEVEVRRIKASGGDYETLYGGAFLVDVQWMEISPFYEAYFQKPMGQ